MDPLALFKSERILAREAQDPMANLCTVGSNGAGNGTEAPEMRTLVLRDVGEDLAIFINATSPKWPELQNTASVLTYWPSTQIQYRLLAHTLPVASQLVAESWLLRPDAPKKMDWFYTTKMPQSAKAGTRQALLEQVNALSPPEPLVAPDTAQGLVLKPFRIERLDLTQDNGIHDRTLYVHSEGAWTVETLVP